MDGFEEIISKACPEIQKLAKQAKALILALYPKVVDVPWPKQNIIG